MITKTINSIFTAIVLSTFVFFVPFSVGAEEKKETSSVVKISLGNLPKPDNSLTNNSNAKVELDSLLTDQIMPNLDRCTNVLSRADALGIQGKEALSRMNKLEFPKEDQRGAMTSVLLGGRFLLASSQYGAQEREFRNFAKRVAPYKGTDPRNLPIYKNLVPKFAEHADALEKSLARLEIAVNNLNNFLDSN